MYDVKSNRGLQAIGRLAMELHKAEKLCSAKTEDYAKASVAEKTTRRLHETVLASIAAANETVDAANVQVLTASEKRDAALKDLNALQAKDSTMKANINTYAAQTVAAREVRVEAEAARDAAKDRYEKAVTDLSQSIRDQEATGSAGAILAGQKRKASTPSSQQPTGKDSSKKQKQA